MKIKFSKQDKLLIVFGVIFVLASLGFTTYLKHSANKRATVVRLNEIEQEKALKALKTQTNSQKKSYSSVSSELNFDDNYAFASTDSNISADRYDRRKKDGKLDKFSSFARIRIAQTILPKKNPGFYSIPLKIKSSSRCGVGDFDIIVKDVEIIPKGVNNLILSIEKLNPDNTNSVIYSKVLSAYSFLHGDRFELKLPVQDNGVYGLFVCSSKPTSTGTFNNKSEGCGDKEVVSIVALSKELKKRSSNYSAEEFKNKIYYFSPLLLDSNSMILPSEKQITSPEKLTSELVLVGNQGASPSLNKKILNLISSTESVLPRGPYGTASIDLPHLNLKKCEKRG